MIIDGTYKKILTLWRGNLQSHIYIEEFIVTIFGLSDMERRWPLKGDYVDQSEGEVYSYAMTRERDPHVRQRVKRLEKIGLSWIRLVLLAKCQPKTCSLWTNNKTTNPCKILKQPKTKHQENVSSRIYHLIRGSLKSILKII